MNPKSILIIGTVDTKGAQLQFLKERIASRGHQPVLMDISMGRLPEFQAEITPQEIAALAGWDLKDILSSKNRASATNAMTAGAQQKALDLLSRGALHGIVALGGATLALAGARVMSQLPFGIPKIIATTAAVPVYIVGWFGATDVSVMQLILEIAGMNELVKNSLAQVAGAISGMVEEAQDYSTLRLPYPSVAITQIGFSDECAKNVENLLMEKGYHVCPFHANGVSDRAMDRLISEGLFDGVIEIVPAGVIEEKFKGNRAAGLERLDAALESGIPQVWAPCCLNITGAGPTRTNREKYTASGRLFEVDQMRSMARYPVDELLIGAKLYADKINKGKGPLKLVIPLRGWSSIDREGTVLYNPDEDRIFVNELKRNLKREIEIVEVDCNLEDLDTAKVLVDSLDTYMKASAEGKKNKKGGQKQEKEKEGKSRHSDGAP